MSTVLVLGSCGIDFTLRLPRLPRPGETLTGDNLIVGPGGKGANQAVAARRAGAAVTFVTAMGDDDFGRDLVRRYSDEGIILTHAKRLSGIATGTALIFLGQDGQNAIGIYPAANSKLDAKMVEDLPEATFAERGVFLACLEIPVNAVRAGLHRAKAAGMTTILNPAPFNTAILDTNILSLVDILTPNEEEAMGLTGCRPEEAGLRLLDQGASRVLVTLGSEGALLIDSAGTKAFAAYAVDVVDTVGAGDAFNGALAAALAAGKSLDDATRWAIAAASLSVTAEGAQGGLPHRARVEAFLKTAVLPQR